MTASMQPAPSAPPAAAPVSSPAPSGPASVREAATSLASRRVEAREPEKQAPEQRAPEQRQEPEAPAETTSSPENEPVSEGLEPPKLWTQEAKERFASLDRETQEYLLQQDQAREAEVKKATATVSEKDKTLAQEREAIQKMRAQYEGALPAVLQMLQQQQVGEFGDIKTYADIEAMAANDPARYLKWDAHQRKVQAVQQQLQVARDQQAQEIDKNWQKFSAEQDKIIAEKIPEMADPAKAEKLGKQAVGYLSTIGFDNDELTNLWHGKAGISLRDARVQLIIAEAAKAREAQEALRKAKTQQAVPPVQRPGVAQPRGAGDSEKIKELSKTLDQKGSLKAAAALLAAKRAGRRS